MPQTRAIISKSLLTTNFLCILFFFQIHTLSTFQRGYWKHMLYWMCKFSKFTNSDVEHAEKLCRTGSLIGLTLHVS